MPKVTPVEYPSVDHFIFAHSLACHGWKGEWLPEPRTIVEWFDQEDEEYATFIERTFCCRRCGERFTHVWEREAWEREKAAALRELRASGWCPPDEH